MNTKTVLKILRKALISLVIVSLAVYIFGIFASGINIKSVTVSFIDVLPFMIPFLLITLFVFHFISYQMLIKEQTKKVYPYFLYTIFIPTLISGVVGAILMYMLKHKFSFLITLNHMATSGAILLFLALFYYIKYNYSNKNNDSRKTFLNTKTPHKEILLYAIGLAILNSFVLCILLYPSFSLMSAVLIFVDSVIIAIISWYLVCFVNKYLRKKLSSSILIVSSIVIIVMCLQPIIIGIRYLQVSIFGYESGIPFNRFTIHDQIQFNLLLSIFVMFAVLLYQLLYFRNAHTVEQKAFKAEIEKQTEKYESLRRQLSPHFLFNNINVLTGLIEENPKKAVHFSETLGNIYRHFLRQENEDVVSLQSALSFSKDYLELLKYRYEEAFQYVLPETVDANYYIIPLALQQVIENTIKHNEVSKENPLLITIKIEDNYLIVQNTKQLKTTIETTKKTGIENIRKRYAFLTEKEVIVEDTKSVFTIKLPLLNMENS